MVFRNGAAHPLNVGTRPYDGLMRFSDEDLLDFAEEELTIYEPGRARRLLEEHSDVYRAQLIAARHLSIWAERIEQRPAYGVDQRHLKGFMNALLEVAAHLRQGDYLPGGRLYEDDEGRTDVASFMRPPSAGTG